MFSLRGDIDIETELYGAVVKMTASLLDWRHVQNYSPDPLLSESMPIRALCGHLECFVQRRQLQLATDGRLRAPLRIGTSFFPLQRHGEE